MNETERDQLAQSTAEHIADVLIPNSEATHQLSGVTVHYLDENRPPTAVPHIKAALLDGRVWISWLDERVTQAMRQLHGEPTSDAAVFADHT